MLSNFSLLQYFDGGGIQLLRLHLDGDRGLIKWECTKKEQEVRGGELCQYSGELGERSRDIFCGIYRVYRGWLQQATKL